MCPPGAGNTTPVANRPPHPPDPLDALVEGVGSPRLIRFLPNLRTNEFTHDDFVRAAKRGEDTVKRLLERLQRVHERETGSKLSEADLFRLEDGIFGLASS